MLFLIFILILFVYLIIKNNFISLLLDYKRCWDFSAKIRGPSMLELFKHSKKEKVVPWLKQVASKYGPTFPIWFGKDMIVFVLDPEDVKIVLSSNELLYKSNNYHLFEPWLGKGLLTNGGEDWHKKRKMLTPAFHFKILGTFKTPMADCTKILLQRLEEKADGEILDIYPFITLYAMDVICETAMGIKVNAQINSESKYVRAVQTICGLMHKKSFSVWRRIDLLFRLSSDYPKFKETLSTIYAETRRVIEVRRKLLNDDPIKETDEDDVLLGQKRRLAFLDILLHLQNEGADLTDDNIREEVDTFMFEGHDTTSSAIAFAIYLLSKNQDAQNLLYLEIKDLNNDNLDSMKYLDAVIKETLRIYPSVPFFSRKIKHDFKITNLTIPRGATVSIMPYMIHRDPILYPNPEKFEPTRFLDDSINRHTFAHVAFSAGPRNCVGQKFAMLELKMTLFKFCKHFEILPADDFEPQLIAELILKSMNGVQVRLKKRNK